MYKLIPLLMFFECDLTIIFHGHLDYFQKLPLGGRPNTKPRDHGTLNAHNHWFILFYHVWGPPWIEIHWNSMWLRPYHIWLHTTFEDPWPHYIIMGVPWDRLWTLSFGLSQSHGHGSWYQREWSKCLYLNVFFLEYTAACDSSLSLLPGNM